MKAFINCKGCKQEVDIIDVFKLSGYTFFIHENEVGYITSEWKSGLSIPGEYTSINEVKAGAKARYKRMKKTKFEFIMEISKIYYGVVNEGNPPTRKQVLEAAHGQV